MMEPSILLVAFAVCGSCQPDMTVKGTGRFLRLPAWLWEWHPPLSRPARTLVPTVGDLIHEGKVGHLGLSGAGAAAIRCARGADGRGGGEPVQLLHAGTGAGGATRLRGTGVSASSPTSRSA